jgi:RNA-directed DNA polymerase
MALTNQLPIYKVAYDLLDSVTDSVRSMPRDFKQSIGGKISAECVEIVVLIFRANCARDKALHLGELIERLQVAELLLRLSRDKRLTNQPAHLGLPIGNLSSQFFANVYLDVLDQFVKHQIGARHYIRYVDDFVLLHESPQWLNAAHDEIESFLPECLHAGLNPSKTILQPIDRGIDFVGQVIKPWRRITRRRTFNDALRRVREIESSKLFETANSYFGLLRQSGHSHHDRATLANILRYRGHCIKADFTKTYRRSV